MTITKYFARIIIIIIVTVIIAVVLSSCSMRSIPECDTHAKISKVDTSTPYVRQSIKMNTAEKKATTIAIICTILILSVN